VVLSLKKHRDYLPLSLPYTNPYPKTFNVHYVGQNSLLTFIIVVFICKIISHVLLCLLYYIKHSIVLSLIFMQCERVLIALYEVK